MKHFENNILDGQSTVEAINDLNEIAGAITVNALIVAGGECELDEKDTGAWWSLIAVAEGALAAYPEELRRKGFDIVNEHINCDLAEKARRDEAEQAAKRVMRIAFGIEEG